MNRSRTNDDSCRWTELRAKLCPSCSKILAEYYRVTRQLARARNLEKGLCACGKERFKKHRSCQACHVRASRYNKKKAEELKREKLAAIK